MTTNQNDALGEKPRKGDAVTVTVAFFKELGVGRVEDVGGKSALVAWPGVFAKRWFEFSLIEPSRRYVDANDSRE